MSILTLREKISQLFIVGYSGVNFENCPIFLDLLKNGLGGVIFFTQNIYNTEQFKNEIKKIKETAKNPVFLSIDQEGGRVERTENIHNGKKYLSPKFAVQRGEIFLREQTNIMLSELEDYGINMNFAPVLDVNVEKLNPIIGERAYSDNSDEVIRYSKIVLREYKNYKIIPVGKHFPGHGAAKSDSHLTLPVIDKPMEELENIHIRPFKAAIREGLSVLMVAHVYYSAIDKNPIPATVSKNVIQNLLRKKLKFDGVVISDDMVMGGIKGYSPFEACKRGIEAGINMFIFRNADNFVKDLILQLENSVRIGEIDEKLIDFSLEKIAQVHQKYNI